MRVVFMGSPDFGVPTLEAILRAGHAVELVVSQPDRPAGRGRRVAAPPVARAARELGLPLYQPARLRTEGALDPIERARPEVVVVAAFGLLLPRALLDLPPLGCLNVHPSLLPRHRGASPVQATLLAGDEETGVTIIRLTEQMDAGPILAQVRTAVEPGEDALQLEARLARVGARLLVDCLEPWAAGAIHALPQDEGLATYCRRFDRTDAELDWSRPAEALARQVRAFRGRTDAFTHWQGRLLKILAADAAPSDGTESEPGHVLELRPGRRSRPPCVQTGDGVLLLREVALAGRPAVAGQAFLNGYPSFSGALLGPLEPSVNEAQDPH